MKKISSELTRPIAFLVVIALIAMNIGILFWGNLSKSDLLLTMIFMIPISLLFIVLLAIFNVEVHIDKSSSNLIVKKVFGRKEILLHRDNIIKVIKMGVSKYSKGMIIVYKKNSHSKGFYMFSIKTGCGQDIAIFKPR